MVRKARSLGSPAGTTMGCAPSPAAQHKGKRRIMISGTGAIIVATLITNYIISQFLRNSVGVIAPNLAQELGLSAAQIGLLSSTFFFTFALVQIPVGMALDRFGARQCLVWGAAIAVLGCFIFASAETPAGLMVGRAVLGLGTAGGLVGALAVYANRFTPERFGSLTGLHVGIGTLGTLLATAPLAYSAATIGWRHTFLVVAASAFVIGLLMLFILKNEGALARSRRESLRESLAGIIAVLRTPSVGRVFVMQLVSYSSFGMIVGLWAGPYLAHIYGYGLERRGAVLLIPVLTQILGSILWGSLDRVLKTHKLPVIAGGAMTAASLGYLAAVGMPRPGLLLAWYAVFGFVVAFVPLLIAHGKALLASHQIGRGLTIFNVGSMGGTFLAQAYSGFVIGLFPAAADGSYELAAYRTIFALQAGLMLLGILTYLGSRDPLSKAH
jgi:MFS family permease